MLYITLTSFLFILRYAMTNNQVLSRQTYYFVLLALFIFSAFRFEIGCDWIGYKNAFAHTIGVHWTELLFSREVLFWIIIKLMHSINLPYPYINIISSAIFFIGIHILAKRQPDPLSFLIILFPILIINMPMSGIRQGAAIGIFCIALVAFIDMRPIKFLFWIIIATGIHTSAIIFILLLPFATGRFNNTRLAMIALLVFPCVIFFYFLDTVQLAIEIYVGSGREAYGAAFRVIFLALSGCYFLLCVKKKWQQNFPKDYSIVSIGSIAMILLAFLTPISTIIVDRFGYYLIPIQAMIFSRIPYLPFKLNHSLHSTLPYIGLLVIFLVWTQTSWMFKLCYVPYNSWIFGLPK